MQTITSHQPNNDKPLVSFIVTYHNEPVEMLRECLESIFSLSLSDKERELIFVDDGSDICPINDIADIRDNIIYIRISCKGVSVARNTGISAASGDYIQFVNADDYLIRNTYEHCLDLVRYHNPDIVLFQYTDKVVKEIPWVLPVSVSGTEYLRHNNVQGNACCYVFKKRLLINLRFTPGIAYGEDEEFTPQLLLRCDRVLSTEDNAYFLRNNPVPTEQKHDKRSSIGRLSDMEKVIFSLYKKSQSMPETERQSLQRRIDQLTMDYIYNVIRTTKDWHFLKQRIKRLYDRGLYPLPQKHYTNKYYAFARLSSTKTGLKLLFTTISLLK